MGWISIILFCLAIILSTITTIPIIVSVILCFTVVSKSPRVFIAAFLGGLILDFFFLRTLGVTSLFMVIFIFMIFLYQRRFEIRTIPFVFLSCFIGSFIYLVMVGYNQVLIQALSSSLISVLLFRTIGKTKIGSEKNF